MMLGTRIEDLDALFRHQLQEAYDFEHQLARGLERLEEAAAAPAVARALRVRRRAGERHLRRLEQVFAALAIEPARRHSRGMYGILAEARELVRARADAEARDAGLVGAARRAAHFEIAAYDALRGLAERLGRGADARRFRQTLAEETAADAALAALVDGVVPPATRSRRRVRRATPAGAARALPGT